VTIRAKPVQTYTVLGLASSSFLDNIGEKVRQGQLFWLTSPLSDRRLAENQTGKRQVVVIAREKGGKTLPFVFKSEGEALATLGERIEVGSTVHADEARHWDALHTRYLTKRINHQESYSDGEACTNDAESFFSRIRRAEIGIHHHISGKYLASYAHEMAWREDNRRTSNGEQYLGVVNAALAHPVSRQWKGYWQRSN
jgi:ISXO2-like transposase domain